MPFSPAGTTIKLTTEWQYTDPLEGEYFRLRHSEAPNGRLYAIAQAVIEPDGTTQLFDSQVLAHEKGIVDTLRLKKPGWATERRLAFKKLPKQPTLEEELRRLLLPGFLQQQPIDPFSFVRKSEWSIAIEVSDYVEREYSSGSGESPSPTTKSLTYSANGDTNGICYWAGTNYGSEPWTNPHTAGRILVSASSTFDNAANNHPETLVDRANSTSVILASADVANSRFILDLKTKTLKCNRYSLKGINFPHNHPRNWKFQASDDSSSWVDLDTQVNNATINQNTWFSAAINSQTFYRYFSILETGLSSSNDNILALGEWEFYGEAK